MSEYSITSSSEADPRDVQAVRSGLRAYNEAQAGPAAFRPVHLFLRDSAGAVRSGLIGRQLWGWLYVDLFWVEEALRGQGWGTKLLRQAEAEAQRDGCTRALLDTFDFQARPFYEREGYTVFAELEDYPPGHTCYYMWKQLSHSAAEPGAAVDAGLST